VLDIIEAARALTPRALAALDKALDDPARAVQAAQVLLDRAWGRPPVFAEVNNVGDQVIRYDIRWADAKTNSFPEERNAPTIDAPAATHGNAEGEAEAQEVEIIWGDGTKAG
jgi:hypothetical protein